MVDTKEKTIWVLLRLSMAWIFLWPFLDKTFGLGLTTAKENAWIAGGSPTAGFLGNATRGPFSGFFQGLAGNPVVDWMFMIGLLLIGLALLVGAGMKIASYAGVLMLFLMWLAVLPPEHNPFLDDHLIYGLILIGFTFVKAGHWFGIGEWWSNTKLVQKYPFLE